MHGSLIDLTPNPVTGAYRFRHVGYDGDFHTIREFTLTANDFRALALSFDDAEESAHMGAADFRVGGHIFATLAHEHLGFGNLMLSPELQHLLIAEAPEVFIPVAGGWGRRGATHIRLAEATPQQLLKGLQVAWNLREHGNDKSRTTRGKRKTQR